MASRLGNPASGRQRAVALYSGAVALLGLLALAGAGLWATAPPQWTPQAVGWMVGLTLLASLSYRYPLHLMPGVKLWLDTAFYTLALLLLPPFQSGLVALGGYLGGTLLTRRLHPAGTPLMAGLCALYTVLGAMAYRSVLEATGGSLLSGWGLLAGGAGWLALVGVNALGMLGILSLTQGGATARAWLRQAREVLPADLALASIAYLGAVLADLAPWLLPLLAVPFGAVAVALRQTVRTLQENLDLNQRLRDQMEELKRAQAQMLLSARMASVGLLAAGVAHEISNPIFAIQSRAEFLLAHPERHLASPRAREYLEAIHEMAVRTTQIVQALLSYSRRSPTAPLDLNEVVHSTLALVERVLDREAIRIQKDLDPDGVPVLGNRTALQQVLMNLLTNARDAMPEGGMMFLRTRREGDLACLEVRDTGPGIPPDLLDRIFEPFFTTKEVGRGTGLGLYVVRHIVEEHGGRVEVDSAPGQGATFRVLLPLHRREQAVHSQPEKGAEVA